MLSESLCLALEQQNDGGKKPNGMETEHRGFFVCLHVCLFVCLFSGGRLRGGATQESPVFFAK